MSARIIDLAEVRAARAKPYMRQTSQHSSAIERTEDLMQRFQFWTGASGRRYVHTIYSLLDCPALSSANFILVRRDQEGQRSVLAIGRLAAASPTLNLADIRHRGAMLGANEVHVHLLAESGRDSQMVEFDLRTGHFDVLSSAPSQSQH